MSWKDINYRLWIWIPVLWIVIGICGCNKEDTPSSSPQMELLKSDHTGLEFENTLRQSSKFNVFNYMYFYNGGGVSAGDFNQDGLVDLYFTSNMEGNKMFLNQGDLKFKDVSKEAGVEGLQGWTTGCSVVDINNDGLLDIYVSQVGEYLEIAGRNQLYVCTGIENGIPRFEDQARFYGLDLIGFGTQATFFDYDLDGDLDMFQLNHSLHQNGTFGQRFSFDERHPLSGDRLFRNDSDGNEKKFTEVTAESGIYSTAIGYGLGISTGDINVDGWPDIYVCNDFHENDYLYINQKDGTFKEVLTESVKHTSRFSMGVDLADINNDGYPEIFTLDMVPYDPVVLKSSLGEDEFKIFNFKLGYGYHPQFARNNLQLNRGDGSFQEIGQFSGVSATDWSWATLFLDFDHDGYRDLFVSNGIPRRMNDIDYVNFRMNNDLRWKANFNHLEEADLGYIDKMPQIKLPNKFFRNQKNLKFEDINSEILNDALSYSNGAAYADFDNDGDQDIVVNNIDDKPYLYKNLTIERAVKGSNYVRFTFEGSERNKLGIGARIIVYKGEEKLVYEHFPVRGYQSSVEPGLHIGLGEVAAVDSILVVWPDRTFQNLVLKSLNQTYGLKWEKGLPGFAFNTLKKEENPSFEFKDIADEVGLDYRHRENPFVEFNREGLIPHMVSSEGPAVAVGDVNGDGLEDVFFGSSKRKRSALYFQQTNGKFSLATSELIVNDSIFEDVDAVFEDIENDGDLDLIIAAGGNEYRGEDEAMKQRAFINDGQGNFTEKYYFPGAFLTASCVLPADFNGDGLMDFFFGARAKPWNYGITPTSFLFLNKGNGVFEDVTEKMSKYLRNAGLVKNGAWEDMDGDGDKDLVLAIEWQPVTIYINEGDSFKKSNLGEESGWWNFVLPIDYDGDGDKDIIAGNLGSNSKLKPTKQHPVRMYVNDFDDNGQVEQILTYYVGDREIPFANYAELTKQLVSLKKKYLYSKDLAEASLQEIFGQEKLTTATYKEANYLESALFENTGKNNGYKIHPLDDKLQLSTLNAAAVVDLNKDGKMEIISAGNFKDSNIEMGWYDSSFGDLIEFDSNGEMDVSALSGVNLDGQVRRIKKIRIGDRECLIVANNDGVVQVISAR